MAHDSDLDELADRVLESVSMLVRRVRQCASDDDLRLPERSALSKLDRGGPATSAELARLEQISPQSMGATLSALEARGLVGRTSDPADGRRVVLSLTAAGRSVLRRRRGRRSRLVADAIGAELTRAEAARLAAAAPLLERVAHAL